jgi:tetratricopeptide (TPR) repeat protein
LKEENEILPASSQAQESKTQFLAALGRGNYAEAIRQLKSVHFPNQALSEGYRHFYLGSIYFQDNDKEQSRSCWEKAHQLGVREKALADNLSAYYFNQGIDAVAVKDWDSAYLNFQEAVSFNPQDQESAGLVQQISRMRVAQLAGQENYEEALKICYQLKEKNKDDDDLNHNIALLLDRLERHQEANLYWQELIRKWKKEWRDTPSQSKGALSEKLNRAHRHFGENFFKSGKPQQAVQAFEKAVNYKPDDYKSHFELAEYYTENENWQRALKSYQAALKNHPEPLEILNNMAFVYGEMGEYEEMLETLNKVFEREPGNAIAKELLASYYHDQAEDVIQRNPDKAIELLDKGLELAPGNFSLLKLKSAIYLFSGEIKKAEAIYREMIRQRPGDTHLLKAIALAYLISDNQAKANYYFSEMEKAAPDDPYLYLDIADVYHKRGKFKKKTKYLNKALEIGGDDPIFLGDVVEFLMDVGEISHAKSLLAEAIKTFPDSGFLYLVKAMTSMKLMASPEEVKLALDQAIKLGKENNDQRTIQEASLFKNFVQGMLEKFDPYF